MGFGSAVNVARVRAANLEALSIEPLVGDAGVGMGGSRGGLLSHRFYTAVLCRPLAGAGCIRSFFTRAVSAFDESMGPVWHAECG